MREVNYLRCDVARIVYIFQACLFKIVVTVTCCVIIPKDIMVMGGCLARIARSSYLLRVSTAVVLLDQSDVVHKGH